MKKLNFVLIAALAVLMLAFSSFRLTQSGDDKKGLARVTKIQGVEVYLMSEPLREYETIEEIGSGIQLGSSINTPEINNLAEHFVKVALKAGEKQKKQVDAIIYSSGKKAIAIHFK